MSKPPRYRLVPARAAADTSPRASLVLELVRTKKAPDSHLDDFSGAPMFTYLLRHPDDTGRYEDSYLPWSHDVQQTIADLQRQQLRPATVEALVRITEQFLAGLDWSRHTARAAETLARGGRVVVTLRSAAAELYLLAWEYMPIGDVPLCLQERCVLRYQWPGATTSVRSLEVEPGELGRIALAGGPDVPLKGHIEALDEALQAAHRVPENHRTFEARLTAAKLDELLHRQDLEALHLLCHGARVPGTSAYGLQVFDDVGDSTVLSPDDLGAMFATASARLRLVVLSVCHGGAQVAPANQWGSLAERLHRAGVPAVVSSRYALTFAGSRQLTHYLYRYLLVDFQSVEGALARTRAQLERNARTSDGHVDYDFASLQLHRRAAGRHAPDELRPLTIRPYLGLKTYRRHHARLFFGRQRESHELCQRIGRLLTRERPRFLLVAGASGSGKSSLVRAGLLPALEAGTLQLVADSPTWHSSVFRLRPSVDNVAAVKAQLDALPLGTEGNAIIALVIDQFEELFTELPESERTPFMRALWQLAQPGVAVHEKRAHVLIIGTIRAEFVARFGELAMPERGLRFDQISLDDQHRYFVKQLTPEQLEQVIRGPAELCGLRLQGTLVDQLLRDVHEQPGALPLLSHVLAELWQARAGCVLTGSAYRKLGGVSGALARRAEQVFGNLDQAHRSEVVRVLTLLAHPHVDPALATRRRLSEDQVEPYDGDRAPVYREAVERLLEARLLVRTTDPDNTTSWLEIAHESLIRHWPRYQRWLEDAAARLAGVKDVREATDAWGNARGTAYERDYLMTGKRLHRALLDAGNHRNLLGRSEVEKIGAFLDAGTRHRRDLALMARLRSRESLDPTWAAGQLLQIERPELVAEWAPAALTTLLARPARLAVDGFTDRHERLLPHGLTLAESGRAALLVGGRFGNHRGLRWVGLDGDPCWWHHELQPSAVRDVTMDRRGIRVLAATEGALVVWQLDPEDPSQPCRSTRLPTVPDALAVAWSRQHPHQCLALTPAALLTVDATSGAIVSRSPAPPETGEGALEVGFRVGDIGPLRPLAMRRSTGLPVVFQLPDILLFWDSEDLVHQVRVPGMARRPSERYAVADPDYQTVVALAPSPTGHGRIATCVRVANASDPAFVTPTTWALARTATVTPDGTRVYVADQDNRVHRIDVQTGEVDALTAVHLEDPIEQLQVQGDSRRLAVSDGLCVHLLPLDANIAVQALSPGAHTALTTHGNRTLVTGHPRGGLRHLQPDIRPCHLKRVHDDRPTCIAIAGFSQDGRHVALVEDVRHSPAADGDHAFAVWFGEVAGPTPLARVHVLDDPMRVPVRVELVQKTLGIRFADGPSGSIPPVLVPLPDLPEPETIAFAPQGLLPDDDGARREYAPDGKLARVYVDQHAIDLSWPTSGRRVRVPTRARALRIRQMDEHRSVRQRPVYLATTGDNYLYADDGRGPRHSLQTLEMVGDGRCAVQVQDGPAGTRLYEVLGSSYRGHPIARFSNDSEWLHVATVDGRVVRWPVGMQALQQRLAETSTHLPASSPTIGADREATTVEASPTS